MLNYIYIKFVNQTMGEKARSLLRKKGITSHLRRNPNPNHKEGCNFALFVEGDVFSAFEIIKQAQIASMGIERYGDGK